MTIQLPHPAPRLLEIEGLPPKLRLLCARLGATITVEHDGYVALTGRAFLRRYPSLDDLQRGSHAATAVERDRGVR